MCLSMNTVGRVPLVRYFLPQLPARCLLSYSCWVNLDTHNLSGRGFEPHPPYRSEGSISRNAHSGGVSGGGRSRRRCGVVRGCSRGRGAVGAAVGEALPGDQEPLVRRDHQMWLSVPAPRQAMTTWPRSSVVGRTVIEAAVGELEMAGPGGTVGVGPPHGDVGPGTAATRPVGICAITWIGIRVVRVSRSSRRPWSRSNP
jgi:hypothetical protein